MLSDVWYHLCSAAGNQTPHWPRSAEKRPRLDLFADLRECRQPTAVPSQQAASESELAQCAVQSSERQTWWNRMWTHFRSCLWLLICLSDYHRHRQATFTAVGVGQQSDLVPWKSCAGPCGLESCEWWCQLTGQWLLSQTLSDWLLIYLKASKHCVVLARALSMFNNKVELSWLYSILLFHTVFSAPNCSSTVSVTHCIWGGSGRVGSRVVSQWVGSNVGRKKWPASNSGSSTQEELSRWVLD